MNMQQLEYIHAVALTGSFSKAAEKCFVTQPTLSMMVQKLEDELGVVLFDRKKNPVQATEYGADIVKIAQRALREVQLMREYAQTVTGEISGELRVGIIPTVAPFLLPLFLKEFTLQYPQLRLKIFELTTDTILSRLSADLLDIGIAATPLKQHSIKELFLYREEFFVYASATEKLLKKKNVLAEDINVQHLWLLEDGHCLRSQVLQVCTLKKHEAPVNEIIYETGSIDSLIKMVDANGGITIVPELAAMGLNVEQKKCLRQFVTPAPAREISLLMHEHFPRKKVVAVLQAAIAGHVKDFLLNRKKQVTVGVNL